jgi:hypothetical protein
MKSRAFQVPVTSSVGVFDFICVDSPDGVRAGGVAEGGCVVAGGVEDGGVVVV